MSSVHNCTSVRYRAAIYLNNSAVTLLKRERYQDAVETFRVSISIILATIEEIKNPVKQEVIPMSSLYDGINSLLQDASRRCGNASLATEMTYSQSKRTRTVITFFNQQDPCTIIDEIIEESRHSTSNGYTFIIIEPLNQDDVCLDMLLLDCHSILYNFGVAHCLLASQFSSTLDRLIIDELRQSAFRLFRLMEPFFMERMSSYPINSEMDVRSVLLLFALFAHTMSEVSSQLEYTTVSELYKAKLMVLLHSIVYQETFLPTKGRPAAAA
jgi:hypothetical protein